MGVHGLTSFIDSNPHFLQSHHLRDCKLVIDGNNFYYFLYYYCHVRYQFGGDYDQYSKKVKEIFKTLKSCNIEPFVVFDGGYETDGRKLKTVLCRAKERIHLAGFISQGRRGKVLPILAYETFKTTLDLIGVPNVTCDFEADRQLVTLANLWNCPVLSNDSDFFIFNLKAGLIILDYVDFRICYDEEEQTGDKFPFISVQLFQIEHFVKSVKGVDKSCIPLFATLLGNDFVDARAFEPFFCQLKYSQKSKSNKLSTSKKCSKIVAILHWLKHHRCINDATESILSHFRSTNKERVQRILVMSIDSYKDPGTFESFHLQNYFEGDPRTEAALHVDKCKAFNGTSLPTWFVQSLRYGDCNSFYIKNSIVLHRIVQQTQIEDLGQPSTYIKSEKIRQVMYGILLKKDVASLEGENLPVQAKNVEEYVRECRHLKKTYVQPLMELPEYGNLPSVDDIPQSSLTNRRQIVLESLSVSVDFVNQFSPELQMIMVSVLFWLSNAEPKVTQHHLDAVLVCIIFLHAKAKIESYNPVEQTVEMPSLHTSYGNQKENKISSKELFDASELSCQLSVSNSCDVATEKELSMVYCNLNKHHREMPKVTNANSIDPQITHGFSQLQACLLDTINLNKVLQYPFSKPHLPTLINCTFLYNFCRDLQIRSDAKLCIPGMLISGSPLADLFKEMQTAILDVVQVEVFQDSVGKRKKNARKRERRGLKIATTSESVDEHDDTKSDSQSDIIANCTLENKFSALLLDNDV